MTRIEGLPKRTSGKTHGEEAGGVLYQFVSRCCNYRPSKAVLKPPQSRRFARCSGFRMARSVWTAARLPPLLIWRGRAFPADGPREDRGSLPLRRWSRSQVFPAIEGCRLTARCAALRDQIPNCRPLDAKAPAGLGNSHPGVIINKTLRGHSGQ
jgi:hypothetical protein